MIKTGKFAKATLFDNRVANLTGLQVLNQTGCDWVFNAELFNADRSLCCDLKINGTWIVREGWIATGYAWTGSNQPQIAPKEQADNYDNFITCTDVEPTILRGRTAFGFTTDGHIVVLCVADGTGSMTADAARSALTSVGCVNNLVLDGGSSSQLHTKADGTLIACNRAANDNVANYMCIWLAPETTDEVTTAEQWAIANGIVKGNGADYGWTDTPTKSQVALMMYRHDNPAPVTPTAPASTATSTTAQPKTLKGIDVSENQGVIDWDKVKPNISFAMIRAGFGHNNIDKQFVRNASECTRLGIPFGVYWFSYATNADMAAQEAAYCLAAIKPYHLNMPIVFDFEYDSVNYAKKMDVTITKALATSFVTAFCSAIEKAGYWATMYSNLDYLTNYFDASLLQKYDLWFANPVSNPDFTSPPHTCGMWQYSFTGTMDGITGNVDLDIAYQQYLSLIK